MAPIFRVEEISDAGEVSLLTSAQRHLFPFVALVHEPWSVLPGGGSSSFVGGCLWFLGGCAGGEVVGCRWLWASHCGGHCWCRWVW